MKIPVSTNFSVTPGITSGADLQAPVIKNQAAEQLQQTGQAVQQAAGAFAKIQGDILKDANRLRLDDAATQGQKAMIARRAEVRALKGKDALFRGDKALGDEYDEILGKDLDEIGKTLGNDVQRQAWALESANMRRSMRAEVAGHLATEFTAYDKEVQAGKMATAYQLADQKYDDPASVATARNVIRDSVANLPDNKGAPEEFLAAEQVKALTPLHVRVMQSMIKAGQVQGARDYFASPDTQAELTPEARANLSGVLTVAVNESEGQRMARELLAAMPGATEKQLDAAMVEKSGGNTEMLSVMRREAKYQLDLDAGQKRQIEDALMEPVEVALGDAALSGRPLSRQEASAALERLRLASPALYAKAAARIDQHNDEIRTERRAAEDRAREAHDRAVRDGAKGTEASTSAWYTLKTNPSALRVTDLLKLRSSGILSEKHFNDLVDDKKSLIEKRLSDETILSDKAAVDMVLQAAKIETGKDSDPAKLAQFYERFNQRVREAGKPLDQAAKVAVARDLLGEVTKERAYWFDTTQKAFEVQVPPADRVQIIAALKRRGMPVTETNIVNLYQVGQKK